MSVRLAGVGDKISSVTQEVKNVKQDVTRVGSEMVELRKRLLVSGARWKIFKKSVKETAAEQKEGFRKLNERQTQTLNKIFTRYEENKIKLELDFSHKGVLRELRKKKNSLWIRS